MVIDPWNHLYRTKFRLSVAGRRVNRNTLNRSFNDWYCTRGSRVTTELLYSDDHPFPAKPTSYNHAVDQLSLSRIGCNKAINDNVLPNRCDFFALHIIYGVGTTVRKISSGES